MLAHKVWGAVHAPTARWCARFDEQVYSVIVSNAVDSRIPKQNLRLRWGNFGEIFRHILSIDTVFFRGMRVCVDAAFYLFALHKIMVTADD